MELKRRNVYKVAVAYAVVGWLVIQVSSSTLPTFHAPEWVAQTIVLLVLLGFPIALVLAWAFELTPEGIKRAEDVLPADSITRNTGGKLTVLIFAVAVIAAALLAWQFFRVGTDRRPVRDDVANANDGRPGGASVTAVSGIGAKSIAVLPFDNRSEDKANAYFADGIQDEILTRLAKIGDLKVISRTSTQHYKSTPENLREIAKQLGVTNILEGSVQKSSDQVRITAQLINAENDSHIWAETYDRKLTDIFAVESELAQKIAGSLQAKLTGRELQAVAAKPTSDPEAYDAYLRGVANWRKLSNSPDDAQNTINFYKRAVQLDPKFAVAWAALSVAYFDVYSADHTPQRLADAKHAIDTAFQLQPDLGEAYMALGIYRTRVLRDYDGALEAFEKAGERGVNRAMTADFSSYVKRRQGKWEESLALSAQAGDSDPRNTNILVGRAQTYRALRRFKEAHTTLARALEITPAEPQLLALNAEVYQAEGNLKAARALLLAVPADGRDPAVFFIQFQQWGFERRYSDAIKTLSAILSAPQPMAAYQIASYRMLLGFAELCDGEQTAGRSDLIKARDQLERMQKEGDEGPRLTLHLTLINGALHDKEAVERYVSRIQEEISKDAMNGPSAATIVATARAALGENDAAIAALSDLLKIPGQSSLTPALLRLDPAWDPLRKYPRFQKLANSQP